MCVAQPWRVQLQTILTKHSVHIPIYTPSYLELVVCSLKNIIILQCAASRMKVVLCLREAGRKNNIEKMVLEDNSATDVVAAMTSSSSTEMILIREM